MKMKPYLHSLNNLKHRVLLIGFGIACIHFVLTYLLWASAFASFGSIIPLILTAPSYLLTTIINFFLWRYITDEMILVDWTSYTFPYILISSLFYGVVGGLFASRTAKLRFLGIIFILICLLGFIGICLMALAAQSFA